MTDESPFLIYSIIEDLKIPHNTNANNLNGCINVAVVGYHCSENGINFAFHSDDITTSITIWNRTVHNVTVGPVAIQPVYEYLRTKVGPAMRKIATWLRSKINPIERVC